MMAACGPPGSIFAVILSLISVCPIARHTRGRLFVPNPSYQKGYRHENYERKFWQKHFGHFGPAIRSFMSRGNDIRFVDYVLRVWRVSCKVKKLPKWIWKELETNDILSVKEDGKLPV